MGKKEKEKRRLSLDDFIRLMRESFYEGYTRGAIDVTNGVIVVEKTEDGYLILGKEETYVPVGATR